MSTEAELMAALQAGDIDKIKRSLESHPSLASMRDERGVSALMHAYYRGRGDIAELILNLRPDLDIFEATAAGKLEPVSAILDRDPAQVNNWSCDGFTPLHFAAFFRRTEIARELVGRGANVRAVSMNPMEVTPLHSAAAARATEIVRLLLEHGAPVNSRQHGGWTALHAAADHGDKQMIELLLQHGADPAARNDDGKNAAEIAQAKGHKDLLSLLAAA